MTQASPDQEIWKKLVRAHQTSHEDFVRMRREFRDSAVDKVDILREAIRHSRDIATAIVILEDLSIAQRKKLFPELLLLASWTQGGADRVRAAITSLPHEWVLSHIETHMEPLLRTGSAEEYRRLLELSYVLDKELTSRLVERALGHADGEIREVGEDFAQALRDNKTKNEQRSAPASA
jgi:hypothetical protein